MPEMSTEVEVQYCVLLTEISTAHQITTDYNFLNIAT